ncbi:stalk domain-containing protein [Paenibacillus glycanilyticus]|uniref:stalk domain-containing protein n=1 Tax=Paenibacillus glycanilyticus TaxID=126569 RepID=UPI003EB86074
MKNKWIIIMLVFVLVFPTPGLASGQSSLKVLLDGKALSLSQPPVVKNGTNMVPAIPVLKSVGMSIEADTKAGTVKASKSGKVIWLKMGSNITTVNGIVVYLEEPVQTVNGTTMIPVKFISDVLGAQLKVTKDSISISNTKKETMFDIDPAIVVSANYVKNVTDTDYTEVGFTEFYYNVYNDDIVTANMTIKGLNAGSTKKYSSNEIVKSRYANDKNYFYMGSVFSYYVDESQNRLDNKNLEKINTFYHSDNFLNKTFTTIHEGRIKASPIEIVDVVLRWNSDNIPHFVWTLKNKSAKVITYYDFEFYCYDKYGNRARVGADSVNINWKPGEIITESWILQPTTDSVGRLILNEVKFKDGTSWTF